MVDITVPCVMRNFRSSFPQFLLDMPLSEELNLRQISLKLALTLVRMSISKGNESGNPSCSLRNVM
jgi:hypothetical protein